MRDERKQRQDFEPPHTFDRWLIGAFVAAGIFAVLGFSSFFS